MTKIPVFISVEYPSAEECGINCMFLDGDNSKCRLFQSDLEPDWCAIGDAYMRCSECYEVES